MKFDLFPMLKSFAKLFIAFIPLVLIIIPFIILFICLKKKVKLKLRTFKGKGFRPERGNFGLYCYCGKQGKGKTYSLVEYLVDNSKSIKVFSNISNIQNVSDISYFTGFKGLIDIKEQIDKGDIKTDKQLVIVYDEIFTELLKGDKLTKPVMDFLCQMRKRKIIFLTTCQEWAELPLSFRRFCRFQIDCDMKPFLWTGYLVKTFKDAENMKWSNDEQEHVAPIVETTITKCRKYIADSYDTFLRISSVAVGLNAPQADTGKDRVGVVVNEENGISQRSENMPAFVIDNLSDNKIEFMPR